MGEVLHNKIQTFYYFSYDAGQYIFQVLENLQLPIWSKFCPLRPGVIVTRLSMPVEKMYTSPLFVLMKQVKLSDMMKLYKYLQLDQVAPHELLNPAAVGDMTSDSDADEGKEY